MDCIELNCKPHAKLVGGFNPLEILVKHGFIFPNFRGEKIPKIFELPPPRKLEVTSSEIHDFSSEEHHGAFLGHFGSLTKKSGSWAVTLDETPAAIMVI